jgi:hypothetical protein
MPTTRARSIIITITILNKCVEMYRKQVVQVVRRHAYSVLSVLTYILYYKSTCYTHTHTHTHARARVHVYPTNLYVHVFLLSFPMIYYHRILSKVNPCVGVRVRASVCAQWLEIILRTNS